MLGHFTVRLVPPGAPLWRPETARFARPVAFTADEPVIEVYLPDPTTPFGALVAYLEPEQVDDHVKATGILLALDDNAGPAALVEARELVALARACMS